MGRLVRTNVESLAMTDTARYASGGPPIPPKPDPRHPSKLDYEIPSGFLEVWEKCHRFTMTSLERMLALFESVSYLVSASVPGDIVECGVWKGGSAMICAETLVSLGETSRDLWLYDTFSGMPSPTKEDVNRYGVRAQEIYDYYATQRSTWNGSTVDEVQDNLAKTGYPLEKVKIVSGDVVTTIPHSAPAQVSLLRLDTDFYHSTRHSMRHLFPRIARGGVLFIDDYEWWRGARLAVDEVLEELSSSLFLMRVDAGARIATLP